MTKRPKLNPYQVLGVPRNADDAAIKRAYRNKAKSTHPDAGGSSDEFTETQTAFMVLSNHDKRSRFDRDGTIEGDDCENPFSAAIGIIIAGLLQAGQEVENTRQSIEAAPLFAMVRTGIKKQLAEFKARHDAVDAVIAKIRKIASRIKSKKKSAPNFLQRAMEQHATERARELETLQGHVDNHNAALVFLDDYDFEQLMERADPNDPYAMMARIASNTFGSGSFRPF